MLTDMRALAQNSSPTNEVIDEVEQVRLQAW